MNETERDCAISPQKNKLAEEQHANKRERNELRRLGPPRVVLTTATLRAIASRVDGKKHNIVVGTPERFTRSMLMALTVTRWRLMMATASHVSRSAGSRAAAVSAPMGRRQRATSSARTSQVLFT